MGGGGISVKGLASLDVFSVVSGDVALVSFLPSLMFGFAIHSHR